MLQKFKSINMGSMILPHKNSEKVKITVCPCDIKQKLYVTVSLAKFFRRNVILNHIPYMVMLTSMLISQQDKVFY